MYSIRMKDLPEDMRPVEKLLNHGPQVLSNSELLAIIIRTGSRKKSALGLADEVTKLGMSSSHVLQDDGYYGLRFLSDITPEELTSIDGIGPFKAAMIMAAAELGRRVNRSGQKKEKITDTSALPRIIMDEMRTLKEEHFKIAVLNTKKELEYLETISIGSLDKTLVEPREVFYKAIKRKAHTIILVHNHPSGDPTPSYADINITEKLIEIGELMSIPVIDHIVIGDGIYFSFLKEGLI